MNKLKVLHQFWNSFGIPAYPETDVPDEIELNKDNINAYITYSASLGSFGNILPLNASIWYRNTTSWSKVEKKFEEISEKINKNGYYLFKSEEGAMYVSAGTPFGQTISDSVDTVKRIYLNVLVEFFSAS